MGNEVLGKQTIDSFIQTYVFNKYPLKADCVPGLRWEVNHDWTPPCFSPTSAVAQGTGSCGLRQHGFNLKVQMLHALDLEGRKRYRKAGSQNLPWLLGPTASPTRPSDSFHSPLSYFRHCYLYSFRTSQLLFTHLYFLSSLNSAHQDVSVWLPLTSEKQSHSELVWVRACPRSLYCHPGARCHPFQIHEQSEPQEVWKGHPFSLGGRGCVCPTVIPRTPLSQHGGASAHCWLKGFRQTALGTNISHFACKIVIIL